MSILYMEGFEDIAASPDLTMRGATSDNSASFGTKPARYAGGTALIRGTSGGSAAGAAFRRSLARTLTDGIFFSYQFYRTSYNTSMTLISPGCPNNHYACFYGSSAIKLSDDGVNWTARTITMASGGNPNSTPTNICWDPTRNRYWAAYGVSTTAATTMWSEDLITWNGYSSLSNGTIAQSTPRIYFDPASNRMWLATQGDIWVLDPGATDWVSARASESTTTDVNYMSTMAFDEAGNRWYSVYGYVYRGTSADTNWVQSTAIPVGTSRGVAYGNSTVVVVTNTTSMCYSTDGGATFTTSNPLPGYAASATTYIAFFKGAFYVASRGNNPAGIWRSVDGITWERQAYLGLPTAVSGLFTAPDIMWFYSATGVFYTRDGVNWNVQEDGSGITASVNMSNGLTSPLGGNIRLGIVLNANDTVLALLPQSSPTSVATGVTITRDAWHLLECSLVKTTPGQYQYDLTLDGMPLHSQSIAYADWTYQNINTSSLANIYAVATNGSVTLLANNGSALFYMLNGISPVVTQVPNATVTTTVTDAVWTGKQFVVVSNGPIIGSYDGINWRLLFNTGTSITGVSLGGPEGKTLIASQLGQNIWRSDDGGDTWVAGRINGLAAPVGALYYDNGVWIAVPYNSPVEWYASADDGITWNPVPARTEYITYVTNNRLRAQCFGSTYHNLRTSSTSTFVYRITVNSATDIVAQQSSTFSNANTRFLGFNGRYLCAHGGSTNALYTSSNGMAWQTLGGLTSATNTLGFQVVGGALYFGTTTANQGRVVVPELLDYPLDFVFDTYSFSSYDDVIVNDAATPFAGPLGEGRLLKVPLDTSVQSEWAPNPSDLTNVQAATAQPASQASSYVESNEVGQKDVYGTSSFSVPPGYRAAAVQVDGFYSRTLNTIPTARLGVLSGTSEDVTPEVPVTASIGTKVYVSKIVQQDPATGGSWSSAAIANAKVTDERVG